jgi:flagellar basal body-associated protein FliL
MSNENDSSVSETKNASQKKVNVLVTLVVLVLIAVGAYALFNSKDTKKPSTTNTSSSSSSTEKTGTMSLTPAEQHVNSGSTLTVQVWEDSGSQSVNAVQANLTYPQDKLKFEKVDSTASEFKVTAQETGGSGVIKIARGTTTPLTGKKMVATVNFTPLGTANGGSAAVKFSSDTVLLSSTTNKSILSATYGGSYDL